MNNALKLLILFTSLSLAACGFHMRGQVSLPAHIQPLYVDYSRVDADLRIALRNLLRSSGVELTTATTQANAVLKLSDQKYERRTVSIGARARSAEYQLFESVEYELRDRQGKTVFGPYKLLEQRILLNNPNEVVSTGAEETLLRDEMRQRLAERIALQLQSFDYRTAQAPDTPDETAP